jgi:hypothetical protein
MALLNWLRTGGARPWHAWKPRQIAAAMTAVVLAAGIWAMPTFASAAVVRSDGQAQVADAAMNLSPGTPRAVTVKKWRIVSDKLARSWHSAPDWTAVCNYQIESSCDVTVSFTSTNTLTGTLEVTVGTLIDWFAANIGLDLSYGIGHSFTYGSSWTFSGLRKTKFIGYGGFVQDHFKYKITQQLWYCVYDTSPKECKLPNWERWGPWKNPATGKYVYSTVYLTDNQIYSAAKYRCKHPNKKQPYDPCAPGTG